MKSAVIIPARIGSTRLPRKPLRMISGISLIERVYRQCKKTKGIDYIAVATDSDEIARHCHDFGANVIMTSPDCANGSERVMVAAKDLPPDIGIVVNVQGDEPLIDPDVIESLLQSFSDPAVQISTPITALREIHDIDNPGVVKVVTDSNDNILYFSRSEIPHHRDKKDTRYYWRHIGVYGFRRIIVANILDLPVTELEELEKLEQLRWLYYGFKIKAVKTPYSSIEVNTEEDIRKVEKILGSGY